MPFGILTVVLLGTSGVPAGPARCPPCAPRSSIGGSLCRTASPPAPLAPDHSRRPARIRLRAWTGEEEASRLLQLAHAAAPSGGVLPSESLQQHSLDRRLVGRVFCVPLLDALCRLLI